MTYQLQKAGSPLDEEDSGSPGGSLARPVKIALASPYDYAVHGGVNDHIKKLGAQFKSWGHDVRVIAPCSSPQAVPDEDFIPMGRPVPVPSGGSIARVSLSVWLRSRIKALLQREAFDVVHLHEPMAGFVPLNVLRVANSVPSVYIGTFHTNRGTRLYRIGGKRLAMPYFRRLHGRIAVSRPAYEFISRHLPGHYEIIPNGIQVDEFSSAAPVPHLRDGMINLLFVGRLEKRKGLKYLLSAYSRLKWDWPNLRLLVVGSGKPDDDSYRIMGERKPEGCALRGEVVRPGQGPLLQVGGHLLLAGHGEGELWDRAAGGHGGGQACGCQRHRGIFQRHHPWAAGVSGQAQGRPATGLRHCHLAQGSGPPRAPRRQRAKRG